MLCTRLILLKLPVAENIDSKSMLLTFNTMWLKLDLMACCGTTVRR